MYRELLFQPCVLFLILCNYCAAVEERSLADGRIHTQHTATNCNTLRHTATHCNTVAIDQRSREDQRIHWALSLFWPCASSIAAATETSHESKDTSNESKKISNESKETSHTSKERWNESKEISDESKEISKESKETSDESVLVSLHADLLHCLRASRLPSWHPPAPSTLC